MLLVAGAMEEESSSPKKVVPEFLQGRRERGKDGGD